MIKDLKKFVESEEMLEYLTEQYKATPLKWCDIIVASRASIKDKADALMDIAKVAEPTKWHNPAVLAQNMLAAIEETHNAPNGSVFMLRACWRDEDWNENYGEEITPFTTFEQACKGISMDCGGEARIMEFMRLWYSITRWDINKYGELEETVTWFLNADQVMWGVDFEKDLKTINRHCFSPLHTDLNVRTPYQAGEIVYVDMTPFISPFPAVIAEPEREDVTDCCFPQVIYVNQYGKIDCGALKHIPHRYPRFSPLLRLRRYDWEFDDWWFDEKDLPLQIIGEVIKKNPKKGEQLIWEITHECDRRGKTPGVCWNFLKEWDVIKEG